MVAPTVTRQEPGSLRLALPDLSQFILVTRLTSMTRDLMLTDTSWQG